MTFKLSLKDHNFIISITQIRIKAKFKCQLDIFIKNGSQKKEIFQGLKIDDCKVTLPNFKQKSLIKQISFQNLTNKKAKYQKNIFLTFQLRSKSYNAYAGQVEINFNAQKKTKYQSRIQNCVDSQAMIIYQVTRQKLLKSKSDGHLLQKMEQNKSGIYLKNSFTDKSDRMMQKTVGNKQSNLLKKKTVTSVQNSKYRLNFKNPQKSLFSTNQVSFHLGTSSPDNISAIQRNKCCENSNSKISQEQQYLEVNKTKFSKNKQVQNSIQLIQKRFGKLSYSKKSTPQITKKIIQLEKKLDQEKQKSLKLELEVQAYKNQIKLLSKQSKNTEKKYQTYQTEMKKIKKMESSFAKQNQQLKDLNQILKIKLDQKNQQLNMISHRSMNKQKSFKQELKNVYQKLQAISRQKQFKNSYNVNLQQKIQKYEKKYIQANQEKNWLIENEKKQLEKQIKKIQTQHQNTKDFFIKSFRELSKQIEQILKRNKMISLGKKNYFLESTTIESTSLGLIYDKYGEYQWNKQYVSLFTQMITKIQRISCQFHERNTEQNQTIKSNEKQIASLKVEIKQLSAQLQKASQSIQRQKLQRKQQILKLEQVSEQERKQNMKKLKSLKQELKNNEEQIKELNSGILHRNREISSLKILKQQLQQNIQKMHQQMQAKIQEHKNYVNQILKQKQQLAAQLRSQIMGLQKNLQKEKISCTQFKQKSINYKKNIDRLQIQINQLNQKIISNQKQLKSAQETNQLMNKDMLELKNMINQITGLSNKKEKEMNTQNKQLSLQVTSFKQNYKSLQEAKQQIQKNLQNLRFELNQTRQQKQKLEDDYKKIQKVFNVTQKSSEGLKNSILEMKKQNDDLKVKLRKKQQFEAQLEDEFQCNFYQIRQKIIYFMNHNSQMQKQKNAIQRQNNTKMRKVNQYIQSLTKQLNMLAQYQTNRTNSQIKVSQITTQMKIMFASYQKQGVINSFYANQFRQKVNKIQHIYQQSKLFYEDILKSIQQQRKIREKNSVNLRRVSVSQNQSNLNQTILRKSSTTVNLYSNKQLNKNSSPSLSERQPRRLVRNKSMITSFEALNKKKDELKEQSVNNSNFQDYANKVKENQFSKIDILNDKSGQNIEQQKEQLSKLSRKNKMQNKLKPLLIEKKIQKIEQVHQIYTPTPMVEQNPKKKNLKRLNTLK